MNNEQDLTFFIFNNFITFDSVTKNSNIIYKIFGKCVIQLSDSVKKNLLKYMCPQKYFFSKKICALVHKTDVSRMNCNHLNTIKTIFFCICVCM